MPIFLLRHGETKLNSSDLVQGKNSELDISLEQYQNNPKKFEKAIERAQLNNLNFTGFNQTIRVSNFIKEKKYDFKYIFTSESKRAKTTARIIQNIGSENLQIIENEDLNERDYGSFEGKSKMNLKQALDSGEDLSEFSVESMEKVEERVNYFYEYLLIFIQNNNIDLEKENILIVTHGQIIRTFLSVYFGAPNISGSLEISNVSLLKLSEKSFDLIYEDKYELKNKVVSQIKKNIRNNINSFGPSIICLLTYGPFGIENQNKKIDFFWEKDLVRLIKKRHIEIFGSKDPSKLVRKFIGVFGKRRLEERFGEYKDIFCNDLGQILNIFFKGKIPDLNKCVFKTYNYGEIKKIVSETAIGNKEFFENLNDEIKEEINSKFKSEEVPFLKYFYFKNEKILVSYRFKETKSLLGKYEINYNRLLRREMIEDEKEKKYVNNIFFGKPKFINDTLLRLVSDITSNPKIQWDNYEKTYFKRYGNIAKYFLLTDIVGFKINILNCFDEKNFEGTTFSFEEIFLTEIKAIGKMIEIEFRCESHHNRINEKRPGGVHLTYRHIENNLPLEIQILGLQSTIYDLFGPNSHQRYTSRGKKLQ